MKGLEKDRDDNRNDGLEQAVDLKIRDALGREANKLLVSQIGRAHV